MSDVNIFRYRPQHMKADLFRTIAKDLQLDGEFAQGDEGMVIHNKNRILTWSQPNSKFGGVLFYADREQSLAKPAKKLSKASSVKTYMDEFLDQYRLMPIRGKHDVAVKLEARVTEARVEDEEKGEVRSLPVRVDVSSQIELDDLPVIGPRAKVRSAFGDQKTPQFLHVGLWETVSELKKGELIPKDRLLEIINERAKSKRKNINLKVRSITLAYWAREYRGGADVLEPYYFVEVEHLEQDSKKGETGSGPRQVLNFPAYI